MGPFLFVVYINDLPNALSNIPRLYADDTCLTVTSSSIDNLQLLHNNKLKRAKTWMNLNKLTLNETKSNILCINPKLRNCQSFLIKTFDFGAILLTDNTKYRGIEIDSKLNFKTHISKVQSKISKGVGILHKLNKLLPTRTSLTLYYALIFPHLMYGIITWGSTYNSYLTSLQTLQNKPIKAIEKLKSKDRVTPIYKQYNLLKTNDIYRLEIAKFMHHFHTKSLPFIFTDYFMYLKDCHHHKTRIFDRTNFFLPYYRLDSNAVLNILVLDRGTAYLKT